MKRTKTPLYAALDLHTGESVLGSMYHEGINQGQVRFRTEGEALRAQLRALRRPHPGRPLYLTPRGQPRPALASAIARHLVDRLVTCEPRHNRLISDNPQKCDEADLVAARAPGQTRFA